ncbi:hypothetical protein [Lactiplantibacillus plantarum]|uniref:hypothetical protein n=1 Tax=Lactiplantibacillus plantarum TaxID=1590 RepID=UPI000FB4F356|nr:hypothetical protein [Lactiplantibacillus plantarum]MCS6157850.1 hypothetical protein [Lactiplantibacillus plantarum]MCT4453278.1 hypothetical protein [Lactiplantibacillus plantarum]MCT4461429.1 hypothetical protein [Lactiplantibacillus plantarum]QBX94952.1 hypothetical protein DVH03_11745 [Lactiplantibacillus plantarum]VDH12688.1 Uncharacterised protein [Lactiplantibacillus plantarum]
MIKVLKTDPANDPEYRDPFVLLSDGNFVIWAFADEFTGHIGDEFQGSKIILEPLVLSGDVKPQTGRRVAVRLLPGASYEYELYGQINEQWQLTFGDFLIDGDQEYYSGLQRGDYVCIHYDRLDIIDVNKFN